MGSPGFPVRNSSRERTVALGFRGDGIFGVTETNSTFCASYYSSESYSMVRDSPRGPAWVENRTIWGGVREPGAKALTEDGHGEKNGPRECCGDKEWNRP